MLARVVLLLALMDVWLRDRLHAGRIIASLHRSRSSSKTPSELITSLIAINKCIEATFMHVLKQSSKRTDRGSAVTIHCYRIGREWLKRGKNLKRRCIASKCLGHFVRRAVVSSDSQNGFFQWHWLRCLQIQQQSSESERASFNHDVFFGSTSSFVGQEWQRAKGATTIVWTDESDSRGTVCQVWPWYCWILYGTNEIRGWRTNCLLWMSSMQVYVLRMSSMQAYMVHQ
jgi:hypothetical protein